uniref:ATPase AAA-type core domain-containing protein n=1 Tax=Parascaris equorum TaxID=6256 RepID=A0A914S1Y5_PAREQ
MSGTDTFSLSEPESHPPLNSELDLPLIKLASTELVSGVSGESEEKIRSLFAKAVEIAPCVVLLDEIDAIAPKRESAQREMERRIVSQLLTCLDGKSLIRTTNRPDSIDSALRRAGRFDKEIALGIPDERARIRILEIVCSVQIAQLARLTPGYVGADLKALAREASMCAVNSGDAVSMTRCRLMLLLPGCDRFEFRHDTVVVDRRHQDFKKALTIVHPSAKREGFATVPDVSWEDIGALKEIREELQWSILVS